MHAQHADEDCSCCDRPELNFARVADTAVVFSRLDSVRDPQPLPEVPHGDCLNPIQAASNSDDFPSFWNKSLDALSRQRSGIRIARLSRLGCKAP